MMHNDDKPWANKQILSPFPEVPVTLEHDNHVLIIGAGISGLASAWFLQQQGFVVTVLEAGNQVGGNLQSVQKQLKKSLKE
mgnify:FL=1